MATGTRLKTPTLHGRARGATSAPGSRAASAARSSLLATFPPPPPCPGAASRATAPALASNRTATPAPWRPSTWTRTSSPYAGSSTPRKRWPTECTRPSVSRGRRRSMTHRKTLPLASCAALAASLRSLQCAATEVSRSGGRTPRPGAPAAPSSSRAMAAARSLCTTTSGYLRIGEVKWVYRSKLSAKCPHCGSSQSPVLKYCASCIGFVAKWTASSCEPSALARSSSSERCRAPALEASTVSPCLDANASRSSSLRRSGGAWRLSSALSGKARPMSAAARLLARSMNSSTRWLASRVT
mmetsp:Transcript_17565/g.60032  ORF Transcript_17565/g.60032 Transcript_17565/m.60032 type:complete len:299 (-) Transcript_17565:92-988(-)